MNRQEQARQRVLPPLIRVHNDNLLPPNQVLRQNQNQNQNQNQDPFAISEHDLIKDYQYEWELDHSEFTQTYQATPNVDGDAANFPFAIMDRNFLREDCLRTTDTLSKANIYIHKDTNIAMFLYHPSKLYPLTGIDLGVWYAKLVDFPETLPSLAALRDALVENQCFYERKIPKIILNVGKHRHDAIFSFSSPLKCFKLTWASICATCKRRIGPPHGNNLQNHYHKEHPGVAGPRTPKSAAHVATCIAPGVRLRFSPIPRINNEEIWVPVNSPAFFLPQIGVRKRNENHHNRMSFRECLVSTRYSGPGAQAYGLQAGPDLPRNGPAQNRDVLEGFTEAYEGDIKDILPSVKTIQDGEEMQSLLAKALAMACFESNIRVSLNRTQIETALETGGHRTIMPSVASHSSILSYSSTQAKFIVACLSQVGFELNPHRFFVPNVDNLGLLRDRPSNIYEGQRELLRAVYNCLSEFRDRFDDIPNGWLAEPEYRIAIGAATGGGAAALRAQIVRDFNRAFAPLKRLVAATLRLAQSLLITTNDLSSFTGFGQLGAEFDIQDAENEPDEDAEEDDAVEPHGRGEENGIGDLEENDEGGANNFLHNINVMFGIGNGLAADDHNGGGGGAPAAEILGQQHPLKRYVAFRSLLFILIDKSPSSRLTKLAHLLYLGKMSYFYFALQNQSTDGLCRAINGKFQKDTMPHPNGELVRSLHSICCKLYQTTKQAVQRASRNNQSVTLEDTLETTQSLNTRYGAKITESGAVIRLNHLDFIKTKLEVLAEGRLQRLLLVDLQRLQELKVCIGETIHRAQQQQQGEENRFGVLKTVEVMASGHQVLLPSVDLQFLERSGLGEVIQQAEAAVNTREAAEDFFANVTLLSNMVLTKLLVSNSHFRSTELLDIKFDAQVAENARIGAESILGSVFATSSSERSVVKTLTIVSSNLKTNGFNAIYMESKNLFFSVVDDMSLMLYTFIIRTMHRNLFLRFTGGQTEELYNKRFQKALFMTSKSTFTHNLSGVRSAIIELIERVLFQGVNEGGGLVDVHLSRLFDNGGSLCLNYRKLRKIQIMLAEKATDQTWSTFIRDSIMNRRTVFGNTNATTMAAYTQAAGVPVGVNTVAFGFHHRFYVKWNQQLKLAFDQARAAEEMIDPLFVEEDEQEDDDALHRNVRPRLV